MITWAQFFFVWGFVLVPMLFLEAQVKKVIYLDDPSDKSKRNSYYR